MKPMVITPCDAIVHNKMPWSATPTPYLTALSLCDLLPVQLPTIADPIDPSALLDAASGVLITGARSNVHPSHYGGGDEAPAKPFDHDRDRTTLPLIRAAIDRKIPLLCICRGIQELNVVFGGTLHAVLHQVPGRHDHRGGTDEDPLDERFALSHEVTVEPGGLLAGILGTGPLKVNSVHGQAIDRPGAGLRVEARAVDGTIEAVSVPGARAFTLGLQWHPEYIIRSDAPSRAVFDAFAAAVRDHAAGQRADAA